jgi:hypothetical protein
MNTGLQLTHNMWAEVQTNFSDGNKFGGVLSDEIQHWLHFSYLTHHSREVMQPVAEKVIAYESFVCQSGVVE